MWPPWHPEVMPGIGLMDSPDLVSFPPLNPTLFQNRNGVLFIGILQCLAQHLACDEHSINGSWTEGRKNGEKGRRM